MVAKADTYDTYCQVDRKYDGTNIHTSKGESQQYDLSKYFSGSNLRFDVEFNTTPKSSIKVVNGVQQKAKNTEQDDHKILVGQDMIVENNGDVIFAVLAENLEGNYIIRFGTGTKTSAPVFDEQNVELPDEAGVTCFGITLISSTVAVADCVKFSGAITPPYKNHYVIASKAGSISESFEELNNCWLYSDPLDRKTIKYDTSHGIFTQTYLIQYIPFDMDIGEGDPEGYVNIYRFIYTSSEEYLNGYLEVNAPITAETLGLSKALQIASIQTLGDYIFLLDKIQGLVVFKYKSNKVTDVRHYFYGQKTNRYGMGINYCGSKIQLVIAEANQMIEYTLNSLESDLQFQDSYKIEHTLIGTVEIQGNSDYLVLIQGKLVTVHDRYETDLNYIKAQIQSVEGAKLLYSNTLYIFHLNQVVNYILQDPYLEVDSYVDTGSVGVTITATSTNFENSEKCSIYLNSVSVPAASKKVYSTNAQEEIEWTYQTSLDIQIPLEHFYIGPNIEYEAQIVGGDEEGVAHYIRYNEPTEINVTMDDDQEWRDILIVPSNDGYIYAIHTDSKYNILIFHCTYNIFSINTLNCKDKVAEIEFGQPVRDWDFGVWGNYEDVLVVVGEDVPSLVFLYSILDIGDYSSGDQIDLIDYSEAGWGNYLSVIDLDIHSNTLYTILENKNDRFVGITSKVSDKIEFRNTINDEDIYTWDQVDNSIAFLPTQLITSEFHQNVIFVVNGDEVFVINVQDHESKFLDYIPIETSIKCQIFANGKALVVAQADNSIIDRSLYNLNWVSLFEEFEYQTYGYTFIDQFKIAHGKYSGYIYVLAYAKDTKDLNCLIYRTGVENIKTLYKVVEIEKDVTIDSSKKLTITAGGEHTDYVFIQYNGKKFYLRVPVDPNIQIYPFISDGNLYVDYVDLDLITKPWDKNVATELVEHTISIVNSQITVIVDNEKIEEDVGAGFYADRAESKTWVEDTKKWWEGSVLNVTLTCEPDPQVCKDHISVKNTVEKNTDFKGPSGIIDILRTRGHTFVLYQGEETKSKHYNYIIDILPEDLDFSKAKQYAVISEPFEVDCDFMTPALDEDLNLEYIILFCQNYELSGYGVKKVYDQNKEINDGETTPDFIILDFINNINRGQYEFFHDRLFVNFESEGYWGGIYIYDLNTLSENGGYLHAEINNIIRAKALQQFYPDLVITSFEVIYEAFSEVRTEQKFIKLFITDSKKGGEYPPFIRFITLEIENSFAINTDHLYEINWRNFVQREKQFVTEDTQLNKLKILDAEEYFDKSTETDQMVYTVLVQPSNTAMYMLKIYFIIQNGDYSQPMALSMSTTNIYQIYNNYGYHVPYPQIHVLGNTLGVAYYDSTNKRVTLALYELLNVYYSEENTKLRPAKKTSIQNLNEEKEELEEEQEEKQIQENSLQNGIQDNQEENLSEEIEVVKASSKITLHTLEGGVQFKAFYGALQDMPPIAFAMHMGKEKKVQVLTDDMSLVSGLKAYNFTPHTIEITTTGLDWEEQKVFFNLNSDYNYQNTGFYAQVSPNKFQVDDGGGGVSGWIIALCVILGLAVLGAVGFFVYKKKFAGADNQGYNKVLLGNQSDAGFSLQEPTKA